MNKDVLARYSWTAISRGIAAILFGSLAISWPEMTLELLVLLFGVFAIADGLLAFLVSIAAAKMHKRWWVLMVEGFFGITAGAIAFLFPEFTVVTLIYLIAAWAILTGLVEIWAAFVIPFRATAKGVSIIAGIVSMGLGAMIFIYPSASFVVILWFVGAYCMVFGLVMIIFAIVIRTDREVGDVVKKELKEEEKEIEEEMKE